MRVSVLGVLLAFVLTISAAAPSSWGQQITLEPVASLHHPVNVSLTGSGIILSYRINDSSTILTRLYANGTLRQFAPTFSGSQEVYLFEANGNGGFRAGDLFLCSGDSIYRIVSGSSVAQLFATPSNGSTVEFINFDQGAWGNLLYAVTGDGGVWAVNPSGTSSLVTNLGNNLMPEDVMVAPVGFGSFAGDLLVSLERSHSLVAIQKNATATPLLVATFPGQAPERILQVIPNSDLFTAKYDLGAVVRISAQYFPQGSGLILVTTEGEAGQVGSIDLLRASGTNVTVTKLLEDPTSPHFEGAAFVPVGYLQVSNQTSSSVSTNPGTNYFSNQFYLVIVVVFIAIAVPGLILYLRKKR